MDDVQCGGDETNIFACVYASQHNCGGHEGAGVRCERTPSNNYYGSTTTTTTTTSSGQCLEEGYPCYDTSYNSLGNCCEGTSCIPNTYYGGAYCQSDSYGQSTTTTTTGDDFWTTTMDDYWTTTTSGHCCEGSFCNTIDYADGWGYCQSNSWGQSTTTT